jgi:hypothetical protein
MLADGGDPVPAGPASLQLEQRLSGSPKMIGLHISNVLERRFAKRQTSRLCQGHHAIGRAHMVAHVQCRGFEPAHPCIQPHFFGARVVRIGIVGTARS